MSILAIDMLTSKTRLAFGDAYQEYPESRDQAEQLPHQIEVITKNYQGLKAIMCLTGPGSFTGLRVALSSAHALGLSLGIPVIGLRADEAFGMILDKEAKVVLILDTRRTDFAVAIKHKGNNHFDDFQELDKEAMKACIDGHLICGNGADKAGFDDVYMSDPDLNKLIQSIETIPSKYDSNGAHVFYLRPPDVTISREKFEHQALYNQK